MTQRTQFARAYNTGESVSGQPEGTPFINFADLSLEIQGPLGAIKLLPIRIFSEAANYAAGDIVAQGGGLYAAPAPVPAGAFDAGDWTSLIKGTFDEVVSGVGWDFAVSYDADGNPEEILYSSGLLRARVTIAYVSGNPQTLTYETSIDSGSIYTPAGTLTLSYTGEDITGGTWS